MNIKELVQTLPEVTLKEHDFRKCLRFVLTVSDALNLLYGIDEVELIQLVSKHDKRFLNGYVKETIILDNEMLNSRGTVYIGRNKLSEAQKAGDYAIFTIRGKVLFKIF